MLVRFDAMACGGEIRLAGMEGEPAERAIAGAIAEVRRIERKYTRYRPDSLVSRINAAAGSGVAIAVDAETAGLLDFATSLHAQSGGLFDITSGILRRAWNFRAPQLPSAARLAELLPRIGWEKVRWPSASGQPRSIELPLPGMEIDFGGFGKEYAADRAAALLIEAGVGQGYVNLGGDIRLMGPRPDGGAWQMGIQHPRQPDLAIATVPLRSGALATSGDYERYIEVDGKRYCHILDPRSGWPVAGWQSISVIAPLCIAAGALTTIAMLKGAAAPEFLRGQAVAFLAVKDDGEIVHQGL